MSLQSIYIYHTNEEAIVKLQEVMSQGNSAILVKASNGMHFQEIVNSICSK